MVVVVGRGRGALTATSCDSSKTQDEEVSEETRRGDKERRSQGEKGVQRRQGSFKGDVRGVKEI